MAGSDATAPSSVESRRLPRSKIARTTLRNVGPAAILDAITESRCQTCAPRRCRCRELDRLADQWAREHGAKLPSEADTGRLLGDSFVKADQLKVLEDRRGGAREIRAYFELIESRLRALDFQSHAGADERRRLELQAKLLHMRYDGDGMDETAIARAFGKRSHSWASERLVEIHAEANERLRNAGVVAVGCKRPRCGRVITRFTGTGRPPKYCSEKCQRADTERRRRVRRRVARSREIGCGETDE